MAKTHNKKRNIGIIYDQMISSLCESYIENDLTKSRKIIKIIKESFKKGSQLQKELQFFNSFLKMRGLSENLSSAIISEAKQASRSHFDKEQLELEKSKLIKETQAFKEVHYLDPKNTATKIAKGLAYSFQLLMIQKIQWR